MRKTFHFCKGVLNPNIQRLETQEIEVFVELKPNKNGVEVFTASAKVWNRRHTDCIYSGQCLDEIAEIFMHNPVFKKIYEWWKLYHLNDMHAGTPEQERAVEEYKKTHEYDYTEVCEYLKTIGLYEVDLNGKPYRYGHAWLAEEIPESVLKEMRKLLA